MQGNNNRVFRTICIIGVALLAQTASSEPPTAEESRTTSAPANDRVGFPRDYRTRFKMLGVTIREKAPEVLTVYVNEPAASVDSRAKLPFPEGSIILMEFSHALRDANNQLQRDANGKVQKGAVHHVDVMRRGKNLGEAYGANRSGEWEYAGYRLDGTYPRRHRNQLSVPPVIAGPGRKTTSCFECVRLRRRCNVPLAVQGNPENRPRGACHD